MQTHYAHSQIHYISRSPEGVTGQRHQMRMVHKLQLTLEERAPPMFLGTDGASFLFCPQALAREHGGQLTQAEAAAALLPVGGNPSERAGALWQEMGLQVGSAGSHQYGRRIKDIKEKRKKTSVPGAPRPLHRGHENGEGPSVHIRVRIRPDGPSHLTQR